MPDNAILSICNIAKGQAKYITSWQLKNRQKLTPDLVGRWSSCKFSSYLNFFPFSTQNTQLHKIVQNKEKSDSWER